MELYWSRRQFRDRLNAEGTQDLNNSLFKFNKSRLIYEHIVQIEKE